MNFIINIEGSDGCGKRTQSERLFEALKKLGYDAILQSFPNYESESSQLVRMYLRGEFGNTADSLDSYQASTLYAVDRLATMKKLDIQNKVVVLDRYTNSNMTYQNAKIKDPIERDKYEKWILDLEYNILKIPRPDIVFFLDMPPEKSLELAHGRANYKSGDSKDILEEDKEYLAHCYEVGIETAGKYGWIKLSCVHDNGEIKSIDEVHKEILAIVLTKMSEKLKNANSLN